MLETYPARNPQSQRIIILNCFFRFFGGQDCRCVTKIWFKKPYGIEIFFFASRSLWPQWLRPTPTWSLFICNKKVNNKKKIPLNISVSYEVFFLIRHTLGSANSRRIPICTASSSPAGVSVGKSTGGHSLSGEGKHSDCERSAEGGRGLSYHKIFRTWQSAKTVNARSSQWAIGSEWGDKQTTLR